MSDAPSTEVEVFDPEHAELADQQGEFVRATMLRWGRRSKNARAVIEGVAQIAMSSDEFRAVLTIGAADIVMDVVEGERYPLRNADEATKVAARLMDMAKGEDLGTVGRMVNQIEDPAERKLLLNELRERAKEAIAAQRGTSET